MKTFLVKVFKHYKKAGQWKSPSWNSHMEGATFNLEIYAGTKSGLCQRPLYFVIFVICITFSLQKDGQWSEDRTCPEGGRGKVGCK